jgi:hypothetical protein
VTADGAVAFTCSATSAGGTTNQPVTIKRDTVPPSAPSFAGITGGAFAADKLPAPNAIGCSATDATSGVTSCVVSGYSAVPGSHTLTATATDQSGLTSSSTLTYTVKPFAAGGLKVVGRQNIRSVLKSGFKVTLTVATSATTLKGPLKVGKKTVGTLKAKKNRGKATLTIKLSKTGKKLLPRASKTKFVLTVQATGPNGSPATLIVTRTLKR